MILKHLGNFPQFIKEEIYSFGHVLWIGYCGACIIVFLSLKKDTAKLDALLPIYDPLHKQAPYYVEENVKNKFGMLKYLFSYESDFPYNLKISNDPTTQVYADFFGGMVLQLFSSYRSILQKMVKYIDTESSYIIDTFAFYLLPSILYYTILIGTLPISFLIINFISCFSLPIPTLKDPSKYAFAAFLNPFDFQLLGKFPWNIFKYIGRLWFGGFITFFVLPIMSGAFSLGAWAYLFLFIKLLPLFLIFYGKMDLEQCAKDIFNEILNHKIGLCAIFLFYSIAIAYKNLNKPIAFGVHLGIVILILLVLNIFVILKNTILSLISGRFFIPISNWIKGC
jgi:hypothetical protein